MSLHQKKLILLIQWLGSESKKHAISIRACNTLDPGKALQRIWERLEDRYGSPEISYTAVLKRLNEFLKIGPKDNENCFSYQTF